MLGFSRPILTAIIAKPVTLLLTASWIGGELFNYTRAVLDVLPTVSR